MPFFLVWGNVGLLTKCESDVYFPQFGTSNGLRNGKVPQKTRKENNHESIL
jgi:hypothetical protein